MHAALRVLAAIAVGCAVAACSDDGPRERQRADALQRRVDTLERRLREIEDAVEPVDRLDEDVAKLDRRVGSLETKVREGHVRPVAIASRDPRVPRTGVGRPDVLPQERSERLRRRVRQMRAQDADDLSTPRGILRWCREQRQAILLGQGPGNPRTESDERPASR